MKKKYNIIALIGKAGSGKDTLLQEILKKDNSLNEIISFTTRPPREGEVDGKNYYFLTKEEFHIKKINGEILEFSEFNNWFYGTGYLSLDENKINIGVFNPDGIETLLTRNDINLQVYYIYVNDKLRLKRQLDRENNPDIDEIIRRYTTDKEDFFDLNFEYEALPNENLTELSINVKKIIAAAVEMNKARK